jgi:HEAT repeat protein
MSIYISYHPLDFKFAHELITYVRNLGFDAAFCTSNLLQNLDQINTPHDKVIAILRPEYLQSPDYLVVIKLLNKISDFFPVLRIPISVDEWSANVEFRPVIDFTDRKNCSFEQLGAILLSNDDKILPSTPKTIYLNNLENTLNTYISPLISLELVNYGCDTDRECPTTFLIQQTLFRIGSLNRQENRSESYQWNRRDYLDNIVEYYKSFAVTCNEFDRFAIAHYLINSARQRATIDKNAPTPIFLDTENWPEDLSWTAWISTQVNYSSTPLEDIATGKCLLYIIGLDFFHFKTHPRKNDFEEWMYGPCPPLHLIIICANLSNLDNHLLPHVVIAPMQYNLTKYRELCLHFQERPFSQFVVSAIDYQITVSALHYLSLNPILAASLLSVKFDDDATFEELGVQEYFQTLIRNLWQIGARRNHVDPTDFTEIKLLLSLAALATEQQRTTFNQENGLASISSQSALEKYFDTDLLSIKYKNIRFSMPFIQDYFAACGLVQFGVPSHLTNLALDKQYRRIPQRWDNSIIISSHISDRKDEILEIIVKTDPMLVLLCIVSGISISSSFYSFVIEQNLNSLSTLGDFRVNFAEYLYNIDPKAATAILVEIMRNAHWSIRKDAYKAFIEHETSFFPGLTEAIAELSDDTLDKVAQALQRLGTDALSTLFIMLRGDNATLRLNAAWAMGELRDKACLPALVKATQDTDPQVCKQVIATLVLLQDINCVPYLIQCLRMHRTAISKTVSKALRHLQDHDPDNFITTVTCMDANSKILVMQAMRGASNDASVGLLLELSKDENADVRLAAIKELGSHSEIPVISRPEDCLDNMSKSKLSKSAIGEIVSKMLSNVQKSEPTHVLGLSSKDTRDDNAKSSNVVKARLLQVKEARIKDQMAHNKIAMELSPNSNQDMRKAALVTDDAYVSAILVQLRERTWTNSSNASKILREYIEELHGKASLHVINQILETLNDQDWVIRWTGVETLGWTGNIHVVPHLVQRLNDSNWKVRIAAIRSLSEIGDNTAVVGLIALLSDNNSMVREAAAEALGALNAKEALTALETAALDQEDFVRLAAIESLGRLHYEAATKSLLVALKDKSEHVRWAAANGLSRIANPEIVPFLVHSLSDTAGPYWEQKRICDVIVDILRQIGSDEAISAIANRDNKHV